MTPVDSFQQAMRWALQPVTRTAAATTNIKLFIQSSPSEVILSMKSANSGGKDLS